MTGSLRPVASDIDPELSSWYKENSRIYVAGDHACWAEPRLTKKIHKRRFGTIIKSSMLGLDMMMQAHAAEAQDWMQARIPVNSDENTTEDDDEN